MNSLQRVQNLIAGQPIDRVPNFDIFMIRAAHHIHAPLSKYYLDHRVLCEANLAVLKEFELDIVQAISDPYREAADMGLEVEFPTDNLPLNKKPLITEPDDLYKMRFPVKGFGARMTDRLDGIRLMREQVGDEVPVMGWVEGAGRSRGFTRHHQYHEGLQTAPSMAERTARKVCKSGNRLCLCADRRRRTHHRARRCGRIVDLTHYVP